MDGTLPAGTRHDLTDKQWAILAPLLPVGKKPGRRPRWTKRQLIDGIRFRTRVGCPWRDVPERYGTWQTLYGLFRGWQLAGPPVSMLRPSGRSVTQVELDQTTGSQVLEVTPRCAAADAGLVRHLRG